MSNRVLIVLAILVAIAAAGGGTYMALKNTRGFRNNNPGNLRWSGAFTWQGQVGQDPEGYVIFDTMENGVRAMTKNLRTYMGRGTDTIREIITRYAPSHENPTNAYISFLATKLGVGPDVPLGEGRMYDLVRYIIQFENGEDLPAEIRAEGIRRAYS